MAGRHTLETVYELQNDVLSRFLTDSGYQADLYDDVTLRMVATILINNANELTLYDTYIVQDSSFTTYYPMISNAQQLRDETTKRRLPVTGNVLDLIRKIIMYDNSDVMSGLLGLGLRSHEHNMYINGANAVRDILHGHPLYRDELSLNTFYMERRKTPCLNDKDAYGVPTCIREKEIAFLLLISKYNRTVPELKVRELLTEDMAALLFNNLNNVNTFTKFTFTLNNFGQRGSQSFAQFVYEAQTIESLKLYNNNINGGFFRQIAANLNNNNRINTIDFRVNDNLVVKTLIDSVRNKTNLKTLTIDTGYWLRDDFDQNDENNIALELGNFLLNNKIIEIFSLTCKANGVDVAPLYADVIKRNDTLRLMTLVFRGMNVDSQNMILEAIDYNTTLQDIRYVPERLGDDTDFAIKTRRKLQLPEAVRIEKASRLRRANVGRFTKPARR